MCFYMLWIFCLYPGIVYFVRPQIGSHRLWNALFLIGISIGSGLMIWGYSVEYYARIFCPSDVSDYLEITTEHIAVC